MQGRFQRGKVGGVSPFFAFQDIITSAMAVLITVVMLLALNLGGPAGSSHGEPASVGLQRQYRRAMDALADATARLRAGQDAVAAAKLDPARLQGEVNSLRAELDALQAQSQAKGDQLSDARRHDSATVMWSEIAKQRAALDSIRARIADLRDKERQSREAMERAEEAMHTREGQLMEEVARKNEIWLIPDRSTSTKEPILAVVNSSGVELQRFDHPEKTEVHGFDLRSKFEGALKNYSKLDQYIVFYFKPSGVDHFDELTAAARSAGFEIGYEGVGEDIVLHFGSAK